MFRNDAKQSLKLKGEKYLEIIDVQIVLQVVKAEAMTSGEKVGPHHLTTHLATKLLLLL